MKKSEKTFRMFVAPQLPMHWIVEHDGMLWIVPAIAGGWRSRMPYHGWAQPLKPVPDYNSIGLCIS